MGESWRNASLKFQPILYRRNFNREGGAEAPSVVFEIPAWSSAKLDHGGRLLIGRLIGRLRGRASRRENEGDPQNEFCHVQSICLVSEERVQGDPRGPGGRPHKLVYT